MKIAVLGTGHVARDSYLPVLKKEKDVELAYYNRTRKKAEACARDFGGTVCDSILELVHWEPDSIFVLTRETVRAPILDQLLELKPKNLFLEKPLVAEHGQDNVTEDDFETARRLMHRAEEQQCGTAMIFNYRFFDQTLKARELLRERDFGAPTQVQAVVNYACWSHCIDLMHDFAGPAATVAAVEGPVARRHGGNEATDLCAAIIFESGAAGTIQGSWAPDFGFPLFELILHFERGRMHMRGLDGDLEVLDYGAKPNRHETFALTRNTSRWEQYAASFGKSIRAYVESLRNNVAPPIPGNAGLRELQFEAALRRSVRAGRPAAVQDEFPL